MKSTVKADFVMPIAVLTIICLVMSAILALTNSVTLPTIEAGNAEREEAARIEALPEADGFRLVEGVQLPEGSSVTEIYEATNGAGYVFMLTGTGYGGKDTLNVICSIGPDGSIVNSNTLSHKETAGLGSKITEDAFRLQFNGMSGSADGVDTISGATKSSNYYIAILNDALAAYELVK